MPARSLHSPTYNPSTPRLLLQLRNHLGDLLLLLLDQMGSGGLLCEFVEVGLALAHSLLEVGDVGEVVVDQVTHLHLNWDYNIKDGSQREVDV